MSRNISALAIALGPLLLLATPSLTRAECLFLDEWPAFDEVAPVAQTVVLGKVVEDRTQNQQGGRLGHFGFLVREAYRGDVAVGSIVDIAFLPPSPPPALCPTYLRPMLGDVLAIAIGASGPDGTTLNSAAWLRGAPDEMMQGLGTINRHDLRALFGLPTTDVIHLQIGPAGGLRPGLGITMLAALTGAILALLRTGRMRGSV